MPKFKSKWADLVVEVGAVSVDIFSELFHEYVVSKHKNVNQQKVIDVSLIRWLCNTLENAVKKKEVVDEKIDKKKLVVDEYVKLKPTANTPQYKQIIEDVIEDLHNSGAIKKLSSQTKLFHRVKSCCVSNNSTK